MTAISMDVCNQSRAIQAVDSRRPVASLPGGGLGGPKGDRVGWGGGGEGITIVSGPGGGGSFEPPPNPPWLRAWTGTHYVDHCSFISNMLPRCYCSDVSSWPAMYNTCTTITCVDLDYT